MNALYMQRQLILFVKIWFYFPQYIAADVLVSIIAWRYETFEIHHQILHFVFFFVQSFENSSEVIFKVSWISISFELSLCRFKRNSWLHGSRDSKVNPDFFFGALSLIIILIDDVCTKKVQTLNIYI